MTAPLPQPEKPKKSLSDIFNEFAADSVTRFPRLKGRFLIADMHQSMAYGIEDISYEKTGLMPQTALTYLGAHPNTHDMQKDKEMLSRVSVDERRSGLGVLFFRSAYINENDFSDMDEMLEKHAFLKLDHELAHLAIQGAMPGDVPSLGMTIVKECIADAYALIRHYQRFGVGAKEDPAIQRSINLIFNEDIESIAHYTSPVLAEIVKRKHAIDFNGLTPEQTAQMARDIADDFAPEAADVKKLAATFAPAREADRRNPDSSECVKALVDIVLSPTVRRDVFQCGAPYLKMLLEDKAFPHGTPIELPPEYLDEALKRLQKMEKKFSKPSSLPGPGL